MARSQRTRTAGNILQKVGRMLSGTSSSSRKRGRRTTRPTTRKRGSTSGKSLLRRLLS
jgi:hypothetical protein